MSMLLTAAVELAADRGYLNVTRRDLAERVGCSVSLVSHYFDSVGKMRRLILAEAIRTENLTLIAQGIINRDRRVETIPVELKQRALASQAR